MNLNQIQTDQAKSRIGRLFRFLQELHRVRTPPTIHVDQYEWNLALDTLPIFSTISIGDPPISQSTESETLDTTSDDDYVLRVTRPKETPCPPLPDIICEWIKPGWQQLGAKPEVFEAKNRIDQEGKTVTEQFGDVQKRTETLKEWIAIREKWEEAETPARKAMAVFSNFFELWGRFQRESERFQLYLGDGILLWDHPNGQIKHPLLLLKVQLDFDPSIPEFVIRESEYLPELNSGLLRYYNVDGSGLQLCRDMVLKNNYHPLAVEETNGFLRHVIQRFWQDGEFLEAESTQRKSNGPCIYRSPTLYLGYRNQGFSEAVDNFLEALHSFPDLPESLVRLVGFETRMDNPVSEQDSNDIEGGSSPQVEVDLLLTKPANPEQERVICRLKEVGSVLVQGPPGTGKSHTIANLIGHLLAEGKTILVASQTSKALKVVREKVEKTIRPLCVSVLDNDEESRKQLEESILGIVNYFSRTDKDKLVSEINDLKNKRDQLKDQHNRLLQSLSISIREEYADIIIGGEGTPPSQAARKLVDYAGAHDWIPGPVEEGSSAPLTPLELAELYASNQIVGPEDEKILRSEIPDIEKLPSPEEAAHLFNDLAFFKQNKIITDPLAWHHYHHNADTLSQMLSQTMKAVSFLEDKPEWVYECTEAGRKGELYKEPWESLLNQIKSCREEIAKRQELILSIGPKIENKKPVKDLIRICSEILNKLGTGSKLSLLSNIFNPDWKDFRKSASVDEGIPKTKEHFQAILNLLEVISLREELMRRWDRQMTELGAPPLPAADERPEDVAFHYVESLSFGLNWYQETWLKCEASFQEVGLNWEYLLKRIPANPSPTGEILRIRDIILDHLGPIVESRKSQLQWEALSSTQESWISYLETFSEKEASYPLISSLHGSIKKKDHNSYANEWKRLHELTRLRSAFKHRYALLQKLDQKAPGWCASIQNRQAPHNQVTVPGDAAMAWKYRQWDQTITRRNQTELDSIQREVNSVKDQLQEITAQYVEHLAWHAQAGRTSLREQQALNGWLGIQKRIGAGTGKRVPILRSEARKLLKECRSAVPVWIMPLSRVMENFDLARTRFDVVILDEASQSDVLGLIAFAIGKEVVVVGDDEQVSPLAVGQQVMVVQTLIDEFLKDIPNKQLYDGKASVYDLARQSFGGTIRLVEHFRCVPDIIQFSNYLCYNGEIKPLREANDTSLYPHLISYRIQDGMALNKVNVEEARTVASLVIAACEMPEYNNLSIGIISLVGIEQALYIDEILRRKLFVTEYQKRKILCGNASQFQGDERDVMFLSMVDSPDEGPLHLRQQDMYRKTFNVAASRARDQLWLIHSLNPETDLKSGDLRLRLIKHTEDPSALRKQYETQERRTDSEFERLVLGHLTAAGYRVVCQWEVGAYNIDMVVFGNNGRKVAIECDGDRFHPPEQFEKDLERQMILERLSWRFIRIRGSEFFRGQERAMDRIFRRLNHLGIEPIGPNPTDSSENLKNNEIKQKVISRAEEIRKYWEENPEDPAPESARRSRRSWTRKQKIANSEPPVIPTEPIQSTPSPQAVSEKIKDPQIEQSESVSDHTILENVCRILLESKKPLMARELTDKLFKQGIKISKQALNQILWNKNTRQDLKHDDNFRWFIQSK